MQSAPVPPPATAPPAAPPPAQQQPLQEINQEDLAAILPDQEHEDAPFDGFEDSESGRLVSKAIERMSLGADSDSSETADQNPVPVYSSTLLQQFVEKTALLSEPRKRRSKLVKKATDPEYACLSNVSPDSGIQSVDNSPLHLAISPASPPVASQSPLQTLAPKPAVNVDRVLYPPKRKPGRPAKMVSTQPRGPGRPRLRPEVVEKIEKIERSDTPNPRSRKSDTEKKPSKNINLESKTTVQNGKNTIASKSKKLKNKKTTENTNLEAEEMEEQSSSEVGKSPGRQENCSSNKPCPKKSFTKETKPSVEIAKRSRSEKLALVNKTASSSVQKSTRREQPVHEERSSSSSRKSSKENRIESTTAPSKKLLGGKKCPPPVGPRRVLKENKSSKKTVGESETNGVGVQTVISLPVVSPMKSESIDVDSYKYEKSLQPSSNHRHKHHHHKHRRRVVIPPKEPIKINPSVTEELEKLIDEFSRSCSLGRYNASVAHPELPQIFRVKKMIKKRKGGDTSATEDQKLKRRLKKEKLPSNGDTKSSLNSSSNSNSNEQRLPLKKRHYHVSSPHSSQSSSASGNEVNANESNSTENHIEEAIEATITRYTESQGNSSTKEVVPVTPKKRHRDAEIVAIETPASESCDSADEKPPNRLEIQPRRKKKIVKDLRVTVTKLASENHSLNDKSEKPDSNAGEKSPKMHTEKSIKSDRAVVEKTEKVKNDKTAPDTTEKTDDSQQTPKIEGDNDKSSFVDTKPPLTKIIASEKKEKKSDVILNVPNPTNQLAASILTKKKIRRRKPINRTGFPTLKKKKKKNKSEIPTSNEDFGELKLIRRTEVVELSSVVDVEISIEEKSILLDSEIQEVLPIVKEPEIKDIDDEKSENPMVYKDLDDCGSIENVEAGQSYCDNVSHACSGKLRVRKDLVECDGSRPCDKLCPVKFEKIQDSRMYDENATLEESLERYNQSQRIGELSVENVKKLDRASSDTGVKLEISGCLNNNHKRRRGSTSPCNLTLRNIKRLRNAGYDTESDALPSSDVASDEPEIGKPLGSAGKRKQPRWKKRYLQAGLFSDYYKEDEPRKVSSSDSASGKNKMIYDPSEHPHGLLPPPYHCGKFLRQRKIHFQLPYDLWWLHTHSRLPGRDLVPSWNYR